MGWDVVHERDLEWEERPANEGQEPRRAATVTEAAHMTVFVYGAPTRHGNAEFLDDVESP